MSPRWAKAADSERKTGRLDTGSADALVRKRVRSTRKSCEKCNLDYVRAARSLRARAPALPVFTVVVILRIFDLNAETMTECARFPTTD